MNAPYSSRRRKWLSWSLLMLVAIVFPFVATPLLLDLSCQVFLTAIGALSLMVLTGYAGQISLGHAGLLAGGAFTVGILSKELMAPFWITLPVAVVVGAILGFIFGLPSLRLRGAYLAISTLALHFVVIYGGSEYETKRGLSSGIIVDPPTMFGVSVYDGRAWFFILLFCSLLTYLAFANLLAARTGRAWGALQTNAAVAEALGINIARYKLLAFVITSAVTAFAGALFAYYRGFVSVEAFSLYLSIQYVAMIIVGGMGSLLGALLGALFVTILPYVIEASLLLLPFSENSAGATFAVNYAAFGIVMILFLVFEPNGVVGIWRRLVAAYRRARQP